MTTICSTLLDRVGRPLATGGTAELAGDLLFPGGLPLPGTGVRPESEEATLAGEAGDLSSADFFFAG